MYRQFDLSSISTNLIEKQIIVEMTSDISPTSISGEDIRVFDCTANNYVAVTYTVSGSKLIITMLSDPVPDGRYIVILQNIESIIGEKLRAGIHRVVFFKSAIKSRVRIIKPAFAEKINSFVLSLEEYIPEGITGETVGSYYLEISTDNLFQNIIQTALLTSSETEIDIASPGQYYIRVRAQSGSEYGLWSEVSTFVLVGGETPPKEPTWEEPIYIPTPRLIDCPYLAGQEIVIEFDYPIDPDSTKHIVVTRRVI